MTTDEKYAKTYGQFVAKVTQLGKLLGYDFADHDLSKLEPDSWTAFRDYLYGDKDEDEYNLAYMEHIHRNKHHWQYWAQFDDTDGTIRLFDIPDRYANEMVVSWATALIEKGKDPVDELIPWYEKYADNIHLSPKTVSKVKTIMEELIGQLKNVPDRMDMDTHGSNWRREFKLHVDIAGTKNALTTISDILGAVEHASQRNSDMDVVLKIRKPVVSVSGNFDKRTTEFGAFQPKTGSMDADQLNVEINDT